MRYLSLISAFWYILPAYLANATPVLLGGGKPLDLGLKWLDGERLFGDHKTFRGFFRWFIGRNYRRNNPREGDHRVSPEFRGNVGGSSEFLHKEAFKKETRSVDSCSR